jgi:hypothetical protein
LSIVVAKDHFIPSDVSASRLVAGAARAGLTQSPNSGQCSVGDPTAPLNASRGPEDGLALLSGWKA